MIKYVKGDVTEATQNIIVHQVNCMGVMGSGVAKVIKEKFPEAFEDYCRIITDYNDYSQNQTRDLLGFAQSVSCGNKLIVNLFSQYAYLPRNVRHTDYEAIRKGLATLKEETESDIAMPKLGCGLGGGDWKVVSSIIESIFDDRDVYIYEL